MIWRFFLAFLAVLLLALPAPAQTPATPDLWVTVFSEPNRDRVAVAYNGKTTQAQIQQDFGEIARNLGQGPPRVKITNAEGIRAAEAEFLGLANWSTGAVNLNPLIQTYKRYGRFRATFFFLGAFPLQPAQNFDQGPLRVETEQAGNVVNYRIFIDQSKGVPTSVPLVTGKQDSPWKLIVGLIAVSAVVAVSVFLIVNVMLGSRGGMR